MDNDDEDIFDFESPDFMVVQTEKEQIISNEQHYNDITEISKNFFHTLEKHDDFNHKASWKTNSNIEPIKILINTEEYFPGICDIALIKNSFISKSIIAMCSDILEIQNILPNSAVNIFDSLYPLSMYGEKIEDENEEEEKLIEGEAEKRISLMLPYLSEIYDKITRLLAISINLCNQIFAFYDKNKKEFQAINYITLSTPFEYLGIVFSYFIAIDTIVTQNNILCDNWGKYKLLIYNAKKNPSQFNMTEEQINKIEKFTKRLNGPIFEKKCFEGCLKNFLRMFGSYIPGQNFKANTIFYNHFTDFLKRKSEILFNSIGTFTELDEKMQVFFYISLFSLYTRIFNDNIDKKVLTDTWKFLKKIHFLRIVGNTKFEIDKYLLKNIPIYQTNKLSLDPKPKVIDLVNHKKMLLDNTRKSVSNLFFNLKLNVMTWVTRVESDLYDNKSNKSLKYNTISDNEKQNRLVEKNLERIKLIINGIALANYINKTILYLLDAHMLLEVSTNQSLLYNLTIGFELIKVIQTEFNRLIPLIAINLSVINRSLLSQIQNLLKVVKVKIQSKLTQKTSKKMYYEFMNDVVKIFEYNCQSSPSFLRRLVCKFCYEMMVHKETVLFNDNEKKSINMNFWKLDIVNQLSKEIKRACDVSYLYFYYTIIPFQLENIFNEYPKRLNLFTMAVNDMEIPLYYIRFLENNGFEMIKKLRKIIKNYYIKYFLKNLASQIENDLRIQVHTILIKGLNTLQATNINLADYLTIENIQLFDIKINIKRYVEEYLNSTFYKMTTINLNDWQTYQQMRVLAKSKYNLDLHEIFLPSQNLQQGKDILAIIRNFNHFVKNYNHNMHNQIFIEISNESANLNVIGINQILNSIYTHGTGIVNSVINKAYQFISKLIQKMIYVINDDYIRSVLKEEKDFWDQNKQNINYNYPLNRAEETRKKIKAVSEDYKVGFIEQLIKVITQIGNGVALARCIRSALMEYNSQNVNLLDIDNENENYKKLTKEIILQLQNDPTNPNLNSNFSQNLLNNTQNSFNDSNTLFCETISSLKQTGENNTNYLNILVTSFGDALSPEKIEDIDLFAFLFPALSITFIERLIVAKDNLNKKNKNDEEAFFSDDGFIIGICYLLKIFHIDKIFDSLNWFPCVCNYYINLKKKYDNIKNTKRMSVEKDMEFNISERKIQTYLKQFETLYFGYSAATVLFNE